MREGVSNTGESGTADLEGPETLCGLRALLKKCRVKERREGEREREIERERERENQNKKGRGEISERSEKRTKE